MMMQSYYEHQQPSQIINEDGVFMTPQQTQQPVSPQQGHQRAQTPHRHRRHHRHQHRSKSPRKAAWCKDPCRGDIHSVDTMQNPELNGLRRHRTGKKDKKKSKKHDQRNTQDVVADPDMMGGSFYYDDGTMMQMTDRGMGHTHSTMGHTTYEGTYDESMMYQQQQAYEQQYYPMTTNTDYQQQMSSLPTPSHRQHPIRYQSAGGRFPSTLPSNMESMTTPTPHMATNATTSNSYPNGTTLQYAGLPHPNQSVQSPVPRSSIRERSLSPAGGSPMGRSLSPAPLLEAAGQLLQQQRHVEHHGHHATSSLSTLQQPRLTMTMNSNTDRSTVGMTSSQPHAANESAQTDRLQIHHFADRQLKHQEMPHFNPSSTTGNINLQQLGRGHSSIVDTAHSQQGQHVQHQQHQQQEMTSRASTHHQQLLSNQVPFHSSPRPDTPTTEERRRTVLWDQRRVIDVRDLTSQHREIHREEREVQVVKPRRVKEDVTTNRTIVIPETTIHEEFIEETQMVQEKIIEVARPVIKEKIVEIYEDDEIIENIIEDVHEVVTETVETKEVETIHECIHNVFEDITEERIVEIPEIEITTVDVYKTVEVPEVHERLVIKERAVNHYIDKPIPEVRTVKVEQDVTRLVPVPIKQMTTIELKLPKIVATYEKVRIPVYLPRFIEVPIAGDAIDEAFRQKCEKICEEVGQLSRAAQMQSVSLCKLESVGVEAKQWEIRIEEALSAGAKTQQERLIECWRADKMQVRHDDSIASLSTDDDFEDGDYDDRTTDQESSSPVGQTATSRSTKSSSGQFSLPVSDTYRERRRSAQTARDRPQRQVPSLHAYSPIRGYVTAGSQFRAAKSIERSTNGTIAGRAVGSAVAVAATQSEVKVYRSRRTAARRDVGGRVIESDEHLMVDLLEATGGRTPNSINMPTPPGDRHPVSFGLSSSFNSDSTHLEEEQQMDARSPLQIS